MGSPRVHTMLRVGASILPMWLPKGKGDTAPSPPGRGAAPSEATEPWLNVDQEKPVPAEIIGNYHLWLCFWGYTDEPMPSTPQASLPAEQKPVPPGWEQAPGSPGDQLGSSRTGP